MESTKLIGLKLATKTTNENGQSGKDCGAMWQKFEAENIASQVPNKLSDTIYAVYYDYEHDEKGYFLYFIGCPVEENAIKPSHLDELIIPKQKYYKVTAKGQMVGCIEEAWKKIWSSNIDRKFGYDFEIYDHRCADWENAEIDIYISVKD